MFDLLSSGLTHANRRYVFVCCNSMMFERRKPVASANLTSDFSGSGHSSINLLASSFSSHLASLLRTASILMICSYDEAPDMINGSKSYQAVIVGFETMPVGSLILFNYKRQQKSVYGVSSTATGTINFYTMKNGSLTSVSSSSVVVRERSEC